MILFLFRKILKPDGRHDLVWVRSEDPTQQAIKFLRDIKSDGYAYD